MRMQLVTALLSVLALGTVALDLHQWHPDDGSWRCASLIGCAEVTHEQAAQVKLRESGEMQDITESAYVLTANHKYCSDATNLKTAAECKAAAAAVGKRFAAAWNGPGDHRSCLLANDGRNKVFFNTSNKANKTPPNSKYASLCKKGKKNENAVKKAKAASAKVKKATGKKLVLAAKKASTKAKASSRKVAKTSKKKCPPLKKKNCTWLNPDNKPDQKWMNMVNKPSNTNILNSEAWDGALKQCRFQYRLKLCGIDHSSGKNVPTVCFPTWTTEVRFIGCPTMEKCKEIRHGKKNYLRDLCLNSAGFWQAAKIYEMRASLRTSQLRAEAFEKFGNCCLPKKMH